MNPGLLLERRRHTERRARFRHKGIRVLSRPRFRKFLLGQLTYDDLYLMATFLSEVGYPVWIDVSFPRERRITPHFRLLSSRLDLDVTTSGYQHHITVGDDAKLDLNVDILFLALMERHPDLRSRCSDCYAHFTPPAYLLDSVRPSAACEHSQERHPVSLTYPGPKLEVSLYT